MTARPTAARQRGAAALVVTVLLLFAMALALALAHRDLLFEQRSAANGVRATQAFEAAEAGLEWATAQLNANPRIGADCAPSADPAAASFRTHFLAIAPDSGDITPRPGRQAACSRSGGDWSCSCPASGPPSGPAPGGSAGTASFLLQFLPSAAGVRVTATGCSGSAGACLPGATPRADARATVEVALGRIGGLRTPPAATLTTRGAVEAGSAALGLHNADPRTGLAVDAGGAVVAPQARVTVPAGASAATAIVAHDAALAALDGARLFAALFGVDAATWSRQPAVRRVDCRLDCRAELLAADAAGTDDALVHVDGDLALAAPLALGSAARPALIVVTGDVRLDGAVELTGLLHAAGTLHWSGGAGGRMRGAVVAQAGYRGDAAPDLVYDPPVLDRLRHAAGSFVRVPGSWRDH